VTTRAEFEGECFSFLEANAAPRDRRRRFVWGEGSDRVALFDDDVSLEDEQVRAREAKAWRARRFDAGLGWISGPKDLGGRDLPRSFELVYNSAESRFAVPDQSCLRIGIGTIGPTIQQLGSSSLKERVLRKLHRGDVIACQLFSEPEAGSDLAGVRTHAVRDGDDWVLNGQKIWTSHARVADIGLALCRSDPSSKHGGLMAFLVDMKAPGVEVRALRQMTGGASFNEVFLNDTRVPDEQRIGDVGEGWAVALATLANERASIGSASHGSSGLGLASGERLRELARATDRAECPTVRQDLAALYSGFQVAKWTTRRATENLRRRGVAGPEASIGKLALSANLRRVSDFVSTVLGPTLVADSGEWGTFAWSQVVLGEPASHIAGGTDEVIRNTIAERVLGLPREPR
jgi:alkylation response protein AidB-like acyl-CoA dehydrogenase